MLASGATAQAVLTLSAVVGQAGGLSRTTSSIFNNVFLVFLVIGTVVGVVVIGYTLYNAVKYREDNVVETAPVEVTGDDADATGEEAEEAEGDSSTAEPAEFDPYADDPKVKRPERGELPTGSGGGKKLFLSFAISAIIVLSLIAWTFGLLQFQEGVTARVADADSDLDNVTIDVEGARFSWQFEYPNGMTNTGELRVPADTVIVLNVTSTDVFHNFGSPGLRFKADAIPGQAIKTWFVAENTGNYVAHCYELCGAGHANMDADIVVMEPEAYQEWYADAQEES